MSKTGARSASSRRTANAASSSTNGGNVWGGAALLLLFTLLCYGPVLSAGYVWDDDAMLTQNPFVRYPLGIYPIWVSTALPDYYPLTSSSFWLEWRFWEDRPLGYHLVNVLLHGASACLLWRVLKALRLPGAWLAALVFAVHPMNVQSVAWIAERKNTLCMFFFLLSVLWYLRSQTKEVTANVDDSSAGSRPRSSRSYYWLSLAAFLCALLSKTAVVMLPVVLLLVAWWRNDDQASAPTSRSKLFLRLAPFFGLSLALGLVTLWFQSHRAIGSEIIRSDDLPTRLAAVGYAFWFYVGKTLAPLQVCFVYPEWKIQANAVLAWLPLTAIVLAFGACWVMRRKWGRSPFFTLSYFLLMLLPILGLVNVYFQRYSPVADHWAYFAGLGLIVFVVSGGAYVFGRIKNGNRWLLPVIAVACVGWFSAASWKQAHAYHDADTLWQDTLKKNPTCWLAHNGLGNSLAATGQTQEALEHFDKGLAAKPDSVELINNLASVLLDQGRAQEAVTYLQKAIKIAPRAAMAFYNLGNANDQLHHTQEAESNYRKAIEIDPGHAQAHSNLGCLLYAAGKKKEAVEEFTHAITIRPDYAEALNNLAVIFLELGRRSEATSLLQDAIRANPNYADAHFTLGNALLSQGWYAEAVEAFRRALDLGYKDPQIHARLGAALWRAGDADEGLRELAEAMRVQPDLAEAHYQTGLILSERKQSANAISFLRQAIKFNPDWPEALAGLALVLATTSDEQIRNAPEALTLATRAVALTHSTNAVALDALAAAYAASGKFEEATRNATEALKLAKAAGAKTDADKIELRKKSYEAGKPYHE
ncbi:MAG: Tetratricopeptide 2 repeat protein [Verrucomicrobiales bacterium]|nr:Tetratricopeptide 2 repeat protein [Verrucomicrobiales bacterium]